MKTIITKLLKYVEHSDECILSHCSAGEPTVDGGYRMKFAGRWYKRTPKCTCGLDDVLEKIDKVLK